MLERLGQIEKRFEELEHAVSDPELVKNPARFQEAAKELSNLTEIVGKYREYKRVMEESRALEDSLLTETESDMKVLYQDELAACKKRQEELQSTLEMLLLQGDDADQNRNVICEIRAGTGGEEAALFVSDLFRMYSRYAQRRGLTIEVMNTSPTGIGGFKEVVFGVSGAYAYKYFKFESGIHRVQRVPATEASGRIHTSAVTVAVLPEAEDVEIDINPKDIRIDVYRSSGPGGQSVNTTDSAVRITHIPTGVIVTCQDEKSQHKNKAKALRVLKARLYEKMKQDQEQEIAANRRQQVGSGDRSGRIRTYNFPDKRVTDHRITLTLHSLDTILEGDLDELFEALELDYRDKKLAAAKST